MRRVGKAKSIWVWRLALVMYLAVVVAVVGMFAWVIFH